MNNKIKAIIGIVIIVVIGVIGYLIYKNNSEDKTEYTITNDSLKFKEEYESLNGKDTGYNQTYQTLDIKSYNPMLYSNYNEIFEILEKGTGIIYFGFPECPWCRNLVPVLVSSALESKVDKIYYLNIKEDRNTLTLTKKGKIKTEKQGNENYLKLVDILKDYLPAYDGLNDETIKRIYLPTVVFVKDGKVIGLQESLESYQKRVENNPFDPMTEAEQKELLDIFKGYYSKLK